MEGAVPWEVYVQPHLNGLRPDFVLLHPYLGVAVIEVKDWNVGAQRLHLERHARWLALVGEHQGTQYRVPNPVARLSEYVFEVASQYARVADWREATEMVSGTLVVLGASKVEIEPLLMPLLRQETGWTPRLNLATDDVLTAGSLAHLVPLVTGKAEGDLVLGPRGMSPAVATRLRPFLHEPDVAAQQRDPLPINAEQKEIATSRTMSGYRRIRGPAGSGKTTALAARAAEASEDGKDVAFVCFNQTLWHYVHDLVVRYVSTDQAGADLTRITFTHYHRWAKWVCFDAGLEAEYRALWSGPGFPETQFAKLVDAALINAPPQYDALFVDEAQDFTPQWWRQLCHLVRPGGEYLLAADRAQDLYQRNHTWTDVAMTGAGFTGAWSELHGCHRLPDNLIPSLHRIAAEFHLGDADSLPEVSTQTELPIGTCAVRWVESVPDQLRDTLLRTVLAMPDHAASVLPWADVCVLVQEAKVGENLVDDLHRERGLRTVHVFDPEGTRGRHKRSFWLGDSRIKVSTIHSFKGWESRAIVLCLSLEDPTSAYVGLTRVKRHQLGSYLTIVCTTRVAHKLRPYLESLFS